MTFVTSVPLLETVLGRSELSRLAQKVKKKKKRMTTNLPVLQEATSNLSPLDPGVGHSGQYNDHELPNTSSTHFLGKLTSAYASFCARL
jgi:hypothetical protein